MSSEEAEFEAEPEAEDTESGEGDEGAERLAQLYDEVELVDIAEVYPYANNPKQHPSDQVGRIVSSIRHYGWDQPIVIDEDGEIIKGHGRYAAARKLGLQRVPAIVRDDLSDAQKRAARIADNKTAESEWNDEVLLTEMEVLQDEGYGADELGFDEQEWDDVWDAWGSEDLGMDDFGLPAEPDTRITLDFESEGEYEDVMSWFDGMMREHGLDSREQAILHVATWFTPEELK